MQNYCINCGKSHKEVGKLINGKCWYCRFKNYSDKDAAICHKRVYLKAYGTPKQQKDFEKFIGEWKNGSQKMP